MKTFGLALGASGSRGVSHVGFLQALEEAGLKPDYITGASMGSIVGCAYAAGVSIDKMKRILLKLRLLDLLSWANKGGLFGTKRIRAMLEKNIGDLDFSELQIPFRCTAVDMISQSVVEFSEGKVLDAIIASSTIPGIFQPTQKDGMRLIDGGVLERVPAVRLKDMGADVIVAVDALGWRDAKEKISGTVGTLLETYDIMDNYRTQAYKKKHKKKIDFWLEPELGDMSQFSLKQVHFAFDKGYELGQEYAPKILEALQD